jgi:hypothetical protein
VLPTVLGPLDHQISKSIEGEHSRIIRQVMSTVFDNPRGPDGHKTQVTRLTEAKLDILPQIETERVQHT